MSPARRAVVRWSWRLLRREWRQHVLVLAVLSVAVGAAVGFAAAAYNLAPVAGNADFGTSNHVFYFEDLDAARTGETVSAAEEWFGEAEAIGHQPVPVPGAVEPLDYRAQDPDGPFGGPLLELANGRYPSAADEVALTEGVAGDFSLGLGETFDLDGVAREVVGLVENPSDLDDEFALVAPIDDEAYASVSVFVDASRDRANDFRPPGATGRMVASRGDVPEGVYAALGVLAVATVALFLVSLVAAASFAVLAQRRLRQLGMLAAIGASEKHLRLVMVASGALTGAVAAVLGTAVGVGAWLAVSPQVEAAVGYRIDALNVPWWLVGAGVVLAVVAATGAAWWPARTVGRVPVVQALSGRPPRPTPAHRSALLALATTGAGIGCLLLAGDVADETTLHWRDTLLVVVGTVATVLGVLLVSPLAIRTLARAATSLPVAPRLALRDLGRYQARAGAALAAISLALGIPVAIVATASAAAHSASAGNLSDHQLLVRGLDIDGPFAPEPADLERFQVGVDRLVETLDDPTVVPLEVAMDPALSTTPETPGMPTVSLGVPSGDGWRDVAQLHVATPALLDRYGVDLEAVGAGTEVLTVEREELRILGVAQPESIHRFDPEVVEDPLLLTPGYTELPGTFITEEALHDRGWEAVGSGRWLIETSAGLTGDQLSAAQAVAAAEGLTIESRDRQRGLATLRSGATAVGMALALGILAMTIGLIRSEATGDLRTLTAVGATGAARRALTAATAGALALLGVALGTVGAYAALAAGFGDAADLRPVPFGHLAAIALGTPMIAIAGGWLLAGRQPAIIARQPID